MGKIVDLARKRFWNTEIFEIIESKIDKVRQMIDRNVLDAYKMLASRTQRIEALESKCRDIDYLKGQVELNLTNLETLNKRLKTLEEFKKQTEALIDLQSFREWLESLKIKKPVPTDKDRPFRVKDIIELFGGALRIVLKVKSEREMELLDVETGDRWWSSCPSNYTLVYRPGTPKPEPTVKEEIPTDKDGKPLEKGDLIVAQIMVEGQDIQKYGIFSHAKEFNTMKSYKIYGWWEGEEGLKWYAQRMVRFVLRPRFPDRKER